MSKQKKFNSYLDLSDLFNLFLDWSIQTYDYDGFTKAHIAVARINYIKQLENKRQDLVQYSLLWDISLWIHNSNYLNHPKETFFDLLNELGILDFSSEEIAPFLIFDQMIFEGKGNKYLTLSFEQIGYHPVLKNKYDLYLKTIINFGDLIGEKEILRDTTSKTS